MDFLYADDTVTEPVTILDAPVIYYQYNFIGSHYLEEAAFEYDGA